MICISRWVSTHRQTLTNACAVARSLSLPHLPVSLCLCSVSLSAIREGRASETCVRSYKNILLRVMETHTPSPFLSPSLPFHPFSRGTVKQRQDKSSTRRHVSNGVRVTDTAVRNYPTHVIARAALSLSLSPSIRINRDTISFRVPVSVIGFPQSLSRLVSRNDTESIRLSARSTWY